MRKYVAEFIGTFFLTLTVCTAVLKGAPLAPLGIGAVLMVMIFAGGHVSGAHFNPAVTVAVFLRGKMPARDIAPYMVSQAVGAALAAGAARWLAGSNPNPAFTATGSHLATAVFAELLFTFALAYVVLNVATSKDHPNNSFYGLAIGFTVLAGAITVGPISGGVFNPAVGVGVTLAGLVSPSLLWLYAIVECAGAALAALAFRMLNPGDLDAEPAPESGDATVPAARSAHRSEVADPAGR